MVLATFNRTHCFQLQYMARPPPKTHYHQHLARPCSSTSSATTAGPQSPEAPPEPSTPGGGASLPSRCTSRKYSSHIIANFDVLQQLKDKPPSFAKGGDILDSIVKVYTVHSRPNHFLPWQNHPKRESTGTGFVVHGRLILTNAHVVSDSTYVLVKRHGSGSKYKAGRYCHGSPPTHCQPPPPPLPPLSSYRQYSCHQFIMALACGAWCCAVLSPASQPLCSPDAPPLHYPTRHSPLNSTSMQRFRPWAMTATWPSSAWRMKASGQHPRACSRWSWEVCQTCSR